VTDLHLERFYTDEQREALVRAYEDPERSAADVVRLAELGELRGPDGRRLPALKAVKAGKRDMRKIAQLVTVQARIDAALQGAPTPAPVRMPPSEPERAIGALMAAHRDNGNEG
jgi:hypothetical protein